MIPALNEPGDDMISELRLRQWARRNYLPPEQRHSGLHRIARGEMELRDQELAAERPDWTIVRTPFVPLLPINYTLDGGHAAVPTPLGTTLPATTPAHSMR